MRLLLMMALGAVEPFLAYNVDVWSAAYPDKTTRERFSKRYNQKGSSIQQGERIATCALRMCLLGWLLVTGELTAGLLGFHLGWFTYHMVFKIAKVTKSSLEKVASVCLIRHVA